MSLAPTEHQGRRPSRRCSTSRRLARAAWVALSLVLAATNARGDDPGDGLPVIAAHREAEILALFRPFELGSEVAPGWKLDDLGIGAKEIAIGLVGPAGAVASARLALPQRSDSVERTPSFSVLRARSLPEDGARALDALVATVRKNDDGHFWPASAPTARHQGSGRRTGDRTERIARRVFLAAALVLLLVLSLAERRQPRAARS